MSSKKLSYKSNYNIKFKFLIFSVFLFLVYFFSNSFIYAQSIKKDTDYLVPLGNILQIDAELKTIIVRGNCDGSPFLVGDSIAKVNNTSINCYGDFSKILSTLSSDEKISVLINRANNEFTIITSKDVLEKVSFNNSISGFATLTYINPETMEFGAVGHPINIGSSKKVPIKTGFISTTTDLNVDKSYRGTVGSISATKKDIIGEFNKNTNFGIKGKISNFDISKSEKYEVASLEEVKVGKAQIILQNSSNQCKKYDIEILAIQKQKEPGSKTFKIKILDKDLLSTTGGIVQGMSGTPIVQGNKIIGAISHAVENDPSFGYGVFIKWMIENEN